jgi:hypothetical protein
MTDDGIHRIRAELDQLDQLDRRIVGSSTAYGRRPPSWARRRPSSSAPTGR